MTALDRTLPLVIERVLIIREPWISLILSGEKMWEMRPNWTSVRGWIGLAAKGTNAVSGLAWLTDCRHPLSASNYDQFFDMHRIPPEESARAIENKWVFPWVFSEVVRLPRPIPFRSSPGAVQFVKLDPDVGAVLGQLLRSGTGTVPPAQDWIASTVPPLVAPPVTARAAPSTPASGVTPAAEIPAGDDFNTAAPKTSPVFIFEAQRARARAVPSGGKRLTVLKGSTAIRSGSPAVKRDRAFRDGLVRQGVLVPSDDPELYVFARDFEFDSASRAAGVVKDGNASGPQLWRDPETGRTLKDYFDRREW